jgi:hypothetical protein
MDEVWKTLMQQAPGATINLMIAYFFLQYMKERDKATSEMLQQLGDSCHESQEKTVKQASDALDRNTRALEHNSQALGYASHKNGKSA